ncbi:MAG: nucleoside-diphosphate-sugar pyrophosphorylase [Thermoleophilia bacterium]|nr:nucleoside-diphosphate-sugar pyrophosphorylase [Thermoleophilia bacterium]
MTDPAPRPRQALLLAAGEGSRLRPLTDHVPKPMLPIDGEAVVERLITQLVRHGIERMTIVVGYRGDVLRTYLERIATSVDLTFVDQADRRGTGHALQLALEAGLERTDTIVAASDTWWRDEDVSRLFTSASRDTDALVTMSVLRWPVAQLPHSMAVQHDEDDRVQRVLHRIDPGTTSSGASALSGSPLYAFRAPFWDYVAQIAPADGVVQLADGIQQAIDDGHVVRALEVHEARDLTRPEDLLRHNFSYLGEWLDEANPPR